MLSCIVGLYQAIWVYLYYLYRWAVEGYNLIYMSKKNTHYRDAGTGRYVSKDYAEKHPKTTVKETDKK